jgi:probable F420-dependent oxidoreductase
MEWTSMTDLPAGFRAGFALPQVFPDGTIDIEVIREISIKAEAAGYDSLWTQDKLVGQSQSIEPITLLSYVAGFTTTARLGVSVLVLPVRDPVTLAKSLASLDVLSSGRLIAGVGLGSEWDSGAFGIPPGRRVRRFLDVLQALDALWQQEDPQFEGEFFQLHGTPMHPKPLQKPRPPIWFGARVDSALRRAVRYGDGWMAAGSSSSEAFRGSIATVREALEQADRDPANFAISKRVYVAIDDDADRAERRLRDWFAHNYSNADMATAVSIWGPAEHCYQRIDELVDAGAKHLLMNPVFDFEHHIEALQRYTGSASAD